MDAEGFGTVPILSMRSRVSKGISLENIARMNREYLSASLKG
jgi:succinate dehydrogenase / fumarate reductase iron-sulfur subunit